MLRTRIKASWPAGMVMSLVAAALFTLIQFADVLVDSLTPRFGEKTPVSLRVPYGEVHNTSGYSASNIQHRYFVPIGTTLLQSEPAHRAAVAYEMQRRPVRPQTLLGAGAIFFTLCLSLTTYLRKFGQNRLKLLRTQTGLMGLLALLMLVAKGQLLFSQLSEFWIPLAMVPLWVSTAFDRRMALVLTLVASFAVAALLRFDLLFLVAMLTQGMGAVLLVIDRKHSRALLQAGVLAGCSAAGMLVAVLLTMEARFSLRADIWLGAGSRVLGCVGGGALAGVLAALLRAPAERLLGQVPRERLHDLTDLEQPLLKHMAQYAPGSWEHSRAMANLAEQAASAIGVDALLVRVGAYYHDLGKSVRPKYFVENLSPGETSPHTTLTPYESAEVIRNHVVQGSQILRDGGIDEPVVEFAYTHHGTQLVEYFWNKHQELGNEQGLTEEDFRYPGMKPQTKETAILMLVDSIEAASRTVDPPERQQFEIMVQRVLFTKLGSGQLDESGLTMRDLNTIMNRMVDTLVNMHHHRIKYPWQARQAQQFGVPARAVSDAPGAADSAAAPTEAEPPASARH